MSQSKRMVDDLRLALKDAYEQSWRASAAMLDNLEAFLLENERRMADLGAEMERILPPPPPPVPPPSRVYTGPIQSPEDRAERLERWQEAVGRASEEHRG